MTDLAALAADIRRETGRDRVIDDRDVTASYEIDWTGRFQGRTGLVLRPTTTHELAIAVARTTSAGVAIVPQGGNTGLVGGGVPRNGEVVLSTRRMVGLEATETQSEVIASAGVTLTTLQQHAREKGMEFGVDLAARESATVGGMIATNAGGVHTIRWGRMRAQVLGLEVVLHDGEIIDHLEQRSGRGAFGLAELMVGSEGTLGIISRARLKLNPSQENTAVALLSVDSLESAVEVALRVRSTTPEVSAVEYFGAAAVDLVRAHRGMDPPLADAGEAYLLVEASGDDPLTELYSGLESIPQIRDSAVATEPGPRKTLWELRDGISEAISAAGVPRKYDIWLPPTQIAQFEMSISRIIDHAGADLVLFGHLAAGSLHANVLGLEPGKNIDDDIYRLVVDLGGSPSSEHGVGSSKVRWQGLAMSPVELRVLQSVKRAFDPNGLLNPGVLIPADPSSGHGREQPS